MKINKVEMTTIWYLPDLVPGTQGENAVTPKKTGIEEFCMVPGTKNSYPLKDTLYQISVLFRKIN